MSLSVMKEIKGETVVKKIQVKENGTAKDIAGMSFKFAVKENIADTSYRIGPVDGVIDDAAQGKVSFTITIPEEVFSGLYEIAMYDALSHKTVLTPPGGLAFRVVESIID